VPESQDINVAALLAELRGEVRVGFAKLEAQLPALDKRVGELESTQTWLSRGIVGSVIFGLVGLVGLGKAKFI
jgi:hypothetical protein